MAVWKGVSNYNRNKPKDNTGNGEKSWEFTFFGERVSMVSK